MTNSELIYLIIGIFTGWGFGWIFPSVFIWLHEKRWRRWNRNCNVIIHDSGLVEWYNEERKQWERMKW